MIGRILKLSAAGAAVGTLVIDGFLVRVALALLARARKAAPYTFDSELAHSAVLQALAEHIAHELESERKS